MVNADDIRRLIAESDMSVCSLALDTKTITMSGLSKFINGHRKTLKLETAADILDCLGYELKIVKKKKRKYI